MKSLLSVEKVIVWNRRYHIYAGLFLLFFIALFSVSGLLLNHGKWKFASFWNERKESETITHITMPAIRDSSALPQKLMEQLNISGEVSNIRLSHSGIGFRVARPGTVQEISIDYNNGICVRKKMVFNWWGKIRTLHTFNGTDRTNPDVRPNWIITRIWRLTMDIVAICLIFLCLSSWVIWYKMRRSYSSGFIVLIISWGAAIFFVYVLPLI